MNKIGIITFHNSYNCGSMLESYAIQRAINKKGFESIIINYSNEGQKEIYSTFFKNNSLKNIIKNILIFPYKNRIDKNNERYEIFKNTNFNLTKPYSKKKELSDEDYTTVVAGSDQIWNITIEDGDDAYFLPWVKKARKVAYAPSFGSKNILKYTKEIDKYKSMINDFDALSIRENNGKKWIKDLCKKDVDVLIDPTLLLEKNEYEKIMDHSFINKEKYIFFYSPSFDRNICKYVKKIADKYKLKVITWSTKSYYIKHIKSFGFELTKYEDPSMYLSLIKNAELVITTSFHGTIFSTIFKKKFITVKNGSMYGDDDRVITLLNQLKLNDRLLPYDFDPNYNYLKEINYSFYDKELIKLKKKANDYLDKNLI